MSQFVVKMKTKLLFAINLNSILVKEKFDIVFSSLSLVKKKFILWGIFWVSFILEQYLSKMVYYWKQTKIILNY